MMSVVTIVDKSARPARSAKTETYAAKRRRRRRPYGLKTVRRIVTRRFVSAVLTIVISTVLIRDDFRLRLGGFFSRVPRLSIDWYY